MDTLAILKKHKIHIMEKTKISYKSDLDDENVNKFYVNFKLPSKYILKSQTNFWTMTEDAQAFELYNCIRNKLLR